MKLGFIFSLVFPALALASNPSGYIKDIEELLSSLQSKDSTRMPLTLKLADAYFNEAIDLSGHSPLSSQESAKIVQDRKRSILLYKDSLSGLSGNFPAPTGTSVSKIEFQLARLYADSGSVDVAQGLYAKLSKQEALPDIQRESLLRLAEILETHSGHGDQELALANYQKALGLCSSQDVCSYCHYRLAWVNQHLNRASQAISEMELSLWDSKGHVREESLRDLVNFLGSQSDDGKASLEKIEKLASKLGRPELVSDLSDSYLAQGHRAPGTYILGFANSQKPNLKATIRLMEEYYGFREWPKFDASLETATGLAAKSSTQSDDVESEKILRRLTVQLDGERMTQAPRAEEFKNTVMLYLQLFPHNAERAHMVDGWIAAEKNEALKITQLKIWIEQNQQWHLDSEALRLRRIRAALAQKMGDNSVVVEEMTALAPLATTPTEKRETQYQIAYAQYKSKNNTAALPSFVALAQLNRGKSGTFTPDKWAVQSQNLALDILAQNKDYQGILNQVSSWTKDANFTTWQKTTEFSKELTDLVGIETNAEFELASAQSQGSNENKAAALQIFLKDCEAKVLTPKSCANAQVIAEKLGDESALIKILTAQNKKDELTAEYEASGQFIQAADLLEKKSDLKTNSVPGILKIALLYELGGDNSQRDRILRQLVAHLKGLKSLGAEEDLILQTLKDANLLGDKDLGLAWSKENHAFLIEYLAEKGSKDSSIQKQLVQSCKDFGPAWQKSAAEVLLNLDDQQRKIHFLGGNSKKKFENRVASLNALVKKADCYLENTTPKMRAEISTLVSRADFALAEEIKSSPMPEGIDEAGKASVMTALNDMAQPFVTQGTKFKELATEQLNKLTSTDEKQSLSKVLESSASPFDLAETSAIKAEAKSIANQDGQNILQEASKELRRNPNSQASLQKFKQHYEMNHNSRLAAYFQGRLQQLSEEVKK